MEEEKKFYTLKNDIVFKNVFLKDEKMAKWLLEGTMRLIDENFKVDNLSIKNCELANIDYILEIKQLMLCLIVIMPILI